jgi:hypothetical protein
MKSLVVNGCNCDGIDAVRVTIEVTLIAMRCTVSTRVDKNGAFSATSIGDPIHEGLLNEITGCFHRFSVVRGPPAATVDRSFLEAEIKGGSFIDVGDGSRQYSNSSDFGIPGNTHTACIIFNSTDLACTTSSVMVVKKFGGGEVFVVIEIVRTIGPLSFLHVSDRGRIRFIYNTHKVCGYIRVSVVKSVVYKGRNDTLPCIAQVPETSDVHRVFRIWDIYQVPLLRKCGVLNI